MRQAQRVTRRGRVRWVHRGCGRQTSRTGSTQSCGLGYDEHSEAATSADACVSMREWPPPRSTAAWRCCATPRSATKGARCTSRILVTRQAALDEVPHDRSPRRTRRRNPSISSGWRSCSATSPPVRPRTTGRPPARLARPQARALPACRPGRAPRAVAVGRKSRATRARPGRRSAGRSPANPRPTPSPRPRRSSAQTPARSKASASQRQSAHRRCIERPHRRNRNGTVA